MMNRRKFIAGSAIAGAGLLAKPRALAGIVPPPKKRPSSVLVIGAGFSGLTAAWLLRQQGVKVTVLEARNRIGGRVYSFNPEHADGQVIELGAEWVGASHTSLIAMCETFGLTLLDNRFETHLTLGGSYSPAGEWSMSEAFENFWSRKTHVWESIPEAAKRTLVKTAWWRWLSDEGLTDRDILN